MTRWFALAGFLLAQWLVPGNAGICSSLNDCNGHGICNTATKTCRCFKGWGAADDIATYKAPDCSQRVCPSDRAWFDVPTDVDTAHALAECSNAGLCNRATGKCRCFSGYEGEACQRLACPGGSNPCSGHGRCMSLRDMAAEPNAVPFGPAGSYGGHEGTTTWDENRIYGCVCDSSWTVGYASGEVQTTQWFGADCSKKHCPSGDDPRTATDETNCMYYDDNGATFRGWIDADGNRYTSEPTGVTLVQTPGAGDVLGMTVGASGNKCFVECSNRGTCDYSIGQCRCNKGYAGAACEIKATFYQL